MVAASFSGARDTSGPFWVSNAVYACIPSRFRYREMGMYGILQTNAFMHIENMLLFPANLPVSSGAKL